VNFKLTFVVWLRRVNLNLKVFLGLFEGFALIHVNGIWTRVENHTGLSLATASSRLELNILSVQRAAPTNSVYTGTTYIKSLRISKLNKHDSHQLASDHVWTMTYCGIEPNTCNPNLH
jgi:hypothetical protein